MFEKLRHGVVQVSSENGTRYVSPSFLQRLHLLWTFRNFNVLPQEVLSAQEQHMIDRLCVHARRETRTQQFCSDDPHKVVIGTIERGTIDPHMQEVAKKACGTVHRLTKQAVS